MYLALLFLVLNIILLLNIVRLKKNNAKIKTMYKDEIQRHKKLNQELRNNLKQFNSYKN